MNKVVLKVALLSLLALCCHGRSMFTTGGMFDISKTVPEVVEERGYSCEEHDVTTPDGYVLTLHRIVKGSAIRESVPSKSPVFLEPGSFGSSFSWVLNTPEQGLVYQLANAGYDVWLGNYRGSTFGQRHKSLDTESTQFWNYTLDDIALYDIPTSIDYILSTTSAGDVERGTWATRGMGIDGWKGVGLQESTEVEEEEEEEDEEEQNESENFLNILKKVPSTISQVEVTATTITPMSSNSVSTKEEEEEEVEEEEEEESSNPSGLRKPGTMESLLNVGGVSGGVESMGRLRNGGESMSGVRSGYKSGMRGRNVESNMSGSRFGVRGRGIMGSRGWESNVPSGKWESTLPTGSRFRTMRLRGRDQLYYIGLSQGSLVGMMAISKVPELESRIKLFISLSPIAKLTNARTPLLKILKNVDIENINFPEKVFVDQETKVDFIKVLCTDMNMKNFCEDLIYVFMGRSSYVDKKILPMLLTHVPQIPSMNTMLHYQQLIRTGKIMSFNPELVGTSENVMGRFTEPESFVYNLKNVNVPVAIFSGDKDDISTPEDVRFLKNTLPNVVHVETIRNYGHMDFVYATNARTMLNNKIMNLLKVN